jgi:hypothetical protein
MKILIRKFEVRSFIVLITIWASFATNVEVASAQSFQCKKLFSETKNTQNSVNLKEILAPLQLAWSAFPFSDPSQHDSLHFVYIVHDIFGFTIDEAQKTVWEHNLAPYQINIIRNPERISEIAVISSSIINQNHIKTYGAGWGVILKVPSSNFMAATPKDMQSSKLREALPLGTNAVDKQIGTLIKRHGLPSPEQILEQTPKDRHNEVLILGTGPNGEKVEVAGFYLIKRGRYNTLEAQDMLLRQAGTANSQMNQLMHAAQKCNIPIILFEANR